MNRIIKFRVWDKRFKQFIDDKNYESDEIIFAWTPFGILSPKDYQNDIEIQQFTCLKDKNGKEIYEGDIVGYSAVSIFDKDDSGHIEKSTIIYQEGYFGLSNLKYDDCQIMPLGFNTNILGSLSLNHKVEILGNIFENKDLLI